MNWMGYRVLGLLPLLLLACQSAPQKPDLPQTSSEVAERVLVVDDIGEAFPLRAVLIEAKRAKLFDGGHWIEGEGARVEELVYVIEKGEELRVAVDRLGVRGLFYVERSAFSRRLRESSWLQPSLGLPPQMGCPGVQLRGGVELEELENRGEWLHVRYQEGALDVRGWIEAKRLDEAFVVSPLLEFDDSETKTYYVSEASANSLHRQPELQITKGTAAVRERAANQALVSLREENILACVWVAEEALGSFPCYGVGMSGSRATFTYGPSVGVERGSLLRESPGGRAWGIVIREGVMLHDLGQEGAWHRVGYRSLWGEIKAFVPADKVHPKAQE